MKTKTVVSAIMAMSLLTGGLAFGQERDRPAQRYDQQQRNDDQQRYDDQQRNDQGRQPDRRDYNDQRRQPDRGNYNDQRRQPDRGNYNDQRRQPDRRDYGEQRRDERGAGPDHAFYRGQRLPPEYRGRQYVVDDWRAHHLNAPPRGYHWVQTGGDYVLVAISTGIILQMLLGN
ncbi:Ni/Co efflux regulator RcnB [Collimonas sp. PA-H2]|uniref:RcnB family protein n=1 Tax=Collimonas sp. PA-H2 TaxID=1881062 RepID=UPI000BFA97DA|nr:RcnB family protein [Collimonas sp. PA-H2]PFH04535.1 Ni/Co efflux regulator RcnB [Collimonas sp. PA-H2]